MSNPTLEIGTQLLIFSPTTPMKPGYCAFTPESPEYVIPAAAKKITIHQAHGSLSVDTEADAGSVYAAGVGLGIGLYGKLGNFIAEIYLACKNGDGGHVGVSPGGVWNLDGYSLVTYWSGITAVQASPRLLNLANWQGTPPAFITFGVDADVINVDAANPHSVDTYIVAEIEVE